MMNRYGLCVNLFAALALVGLAEAYEVKANTRLSQKAAAHSVLAEK